MPKFTKTVVDADLRSRVFDWIFGEEKEIEISNSIQKVNDRQYGIILTDKNGVERYCRLGVIVAEEREDMPAHKLMELEQAKYTEAQSKAAARAEEKAKKAAKDKATREKKKEEKKGE